MLPAPYTLKREKDMENSSFVIFARKVAHKGWSKRHIKGKFLREVEKDDYARSEIGQILDWLVSTSFIGEKSVKSHQP